MADTTTINSAVTDAVAAEKSETTETPEKAENVETTEKKEDDKPDDKPVKYGLSDLEQEQALQLLAALKNPEQAPVVLDFLAKQAGYSKVETKAELKEAKKDIVGTLKDALGPDMDYLAEKLGPAIDKLLNERLEESQKDIRQSIAQREEEKLTGEASTAMTKLAQSFFKEDNIPDEVLDEMNKLMDKMPPDGKLSVADYVENVFYSIVGRKGLKPTDKQQDDRRAKNRTDAPARLASGTAGKTPVPSGDPAGTFKSLDDAIRAAVASQEK